MFNKRRNVFPAKRKGVEADMMLPKKTIVILAVFTVLFTAGCAALKTSKPIVPLKEYEAMIAGRIDAQYVGTQNCLAACHAHDKLRRDFDASTMGVQLSGKSGMPLVDCESCHGPGSLAIEGITPEKVEQDAKPDQTAARPGDDAAVLERPAPDEPRPHRGAFRFRFPSRTTASRPEPAAKDPDTPAVNDRGRIFRFSCPRVSLRLRSGQERPGAPPEWDVMYQTGPSPCAL